MATWLVLVFSFLIALRALVAQNPIVCINDRTTCMEGTTIPATDTDDSFQAFYGIPFALPPIGNLRFAVSVLKEKQNLFLLIQRILFEFCRIQFHLGIGLGL